MNRPATILLLLKRVDCHDGVASYLETLVSGLAALGDRVVIVSGNVNSLYGSEVRRRAIEAAVVDWVVLDDFSASRPKPAHLRRIVSVIEGQNVDVVSPQGFSVVPVGCLVARLSGPGAQSASGLRRVSAPGDPEWAQGHAQFRELFQRRADRSRG